MNFKNFTNIDSIIKYGAAVEDIKRTIEKDLEKIINDILKIEKNYFNNLKPQEIGKIKNISVVLIDGDVVEKTIDMDFVEGNNDISNKTDKVKYIPDNTIWVDSNLDSKTYKYIMLHEYIERFIIERYGLDYETAHDIANHFEQLFRDSMESHNGL